MSTQPMSWNRDLSRLVEDRSGLRMGGAPNQGRAYRLEGHDGYSTAGIRPFPGFRRVHRLSEDGGMVTGPTGDTVLNNDFFVVTVPVDGTAFVSGYVYRTTNASTTREQVRLKYWDGAAWQVEVLFPESLDIGTAAMDVAVANRVCYIFVKGQEPRAFYFDSGPVFNLISDTGPGPKPVLDILGSINNVDYQGSLRNDAGATREDTSYGQITVSTQISNNYDDYPSYISPAEPDQLETAGTQPFKHPPGDYVFGYEFVNTQNGQRSPLSELGYFSADDFPGAVTQATNSTEPTFIDTNVDPQKTGYFLAEFLVDTTKYDEVRIYRSVKNQPFGQAGPFQATLFQAIRLNAADHLSPDTSGLNVSGNYQRWVAYLTFDDISLMSQVLYFNRTIVDEEMPKGGSAFFYNGAMLVSDIGETTVVGSEPNQIGVGEIRYSSTLLNAPEMFPPANRVVPRSYRDSPIAWQQPAGNVIGLSPRGLYFTRSTGGFINFEAIAEGYGIVNSRTADSIGGLLFYLSRTGIKIATTNGALDGMRSFDEVIRRDWQTTLSNTFMVYDPAFKILFTCNPDAKEALLTWMETSTTTSLVDFTFVGASAGLVPDETANPVETAQFVSGAGVVYVYDHNRAKVDGSGGTRTAMLDWSGVGRTVVSSTADQGGGVWSVTVADTLPTNGDLADAFFYVASGTNRGTKIQGTPISSDTLSVTSTTSLAYLDGQTLEISPMSVRWVDFPIGLESQGQTFGPTDRFRVRRVSSMMAYFTDVSGTGAATISATYDGQLYPDNAETTAASNLPVGREGTQEASITAGNPDLAVRFTDGLSIEGSVLAPGMHVYCTDLDFILSGAIIEGQYMSSTRESGGNS